MTTPSSGVIAPTESQGPATGVAAVTAGSGFRLTIEAVGLSREQAIIQAKCLIEDMRANTECPSFTTGNQYGNAVGNILPQPLGAAE